MTGQQRYAQCKERSKLFETVLSSPGHSVRGPLEPFFFNIQNFLHISYLYLCFYFRLKAIIIIFSTDRLIYLSVIIRPLR